MFSRVDIISFFTKSERKKEKKISSMRFNNLFNDRNPCRLDCSSIAFIFLNCIFFPKGYSFHYSL